MTTFHSIQRTQERTGFNVRTSERFIENAIERGKGAEAFSAKERDYLLHKEEQDGCRAIIYNTYCFIVNSDDRCVTMYSAPKWFGKKRYDGKREIRDVKKYARFYNLFGEEDYEYGLCQVS